MRDRKPAVPFLAPDSTPTPAQLSGLGTLFNSRRFTDMEEQARALAERFPQSGPVWKALGTALQVQSKDAVPALQRAAHLLPEDAETFNNLAAALLDEHRARDAETAARRALFIKAEFAEANTNLGKALLLQGRFDEAVAHYRLAVKIKPRVAAMHCGLGIALKDQGDLDAAADAFDTAILLDPELIEAYYGLAQLKTFSADDRHLMLLEQRIDEVERMPVQAQLRFWFALGKVREDLGCYDGAFVAYRRGNHLKHASLVASEAAEDTLPARIAATFTRDFLALRAAAGHDGETPIFIVGMPRSGTTLFEQILSSYPGVHGAGELSVLNEIVAETCRSHAAGPFPAAVTQWRIDTWRHMGEQYAVRLRSHAPGARYITDKMPANFLHLGLISLILPRAKIIHVIRNPMDTCFSCYARLFAGNKQSFSYDLESLGRYYGGYAELMEHWQAALPSETILNVRYEDLVTDTAAQIGRVLDHLGLPWDDRCLDFHRNRRRVDTASAAQVRKPIYRTSLARWRHFATQLAPLAQALGRHCDYPAV